MLERMSEIRKIYAKLASEYDEAANKLFRRWFIRDAEYRRRVIEKLNLKEGNKVLDIGCGTGWNFEYLQKKIGEKGSIIGLDLTLQMLKKAKERIKKKRWKNVDLIQGDAAWLPLKQTFHAVLSTYAISLASPYERALGETSRVLVKGGRIGILDIQAFRGLFKIFNPILISQIKPYAPDPAKYRFPNANKCIQTMKRMLCNTKLEEYYFGMIYVASGVKN